MNTREIAAEYRLAHWAQIVQSRESSGLGVRAFCEQAGLHENTYFYWQRKLREAACGELSKIQSVENEITPLRFTEVKLASQSTYSPAAMDNQNQVSIETCRLRIVAGSGYPIDKLAYLLREVM